MDDKIKITHVTKFAKPSKGGIESFVEMFNYCVKGNDIEVLCCSNKDKPGKDENNVFYNRAKYFFEYAANTFSLEFLWKLSRVKTDVIIYHMPFIFAVVAHFICRPRYKKMIVCYHSDIIGYDSIMKPFWKIYRRFLNKADIIHIQSPQMAENSLAKNYKEKALMIPYLISSKINFNPENVEKIKNTAQGKKILFALGRHVKYKGFKYLIEAMAEVENAVLFLGGSGPLTEEFSAYINENNMQNKIKLTGKIPQEELEDYYEACDIFVLPSIMKSETLAVVQLEAMKHFKPVINTKLDTGVNYVSVDKETGLTVEPEDSKQLAESINTLLNNDDLRLQYGKNARKRVEEIFDIEKNKYKYTEFLK